MPRMVGSSHLPLTGVAPGSRESIRVATAPISWGVCELDDWGLRLPWVTVLDQMAGAGYAGTELGPWGYLPTDPKDLERELGARGLALVGAFCPLTLHLAERAEEQVAEALRTATLLRDLGAEVLVLADAGDDERRALAGQLPCEHVGLREPAWQRLAENAGRIAGRARELGLETVFHPHAGSYVETAAEVEHLLAATARSQLGLCLDTGHLVWGGADPLDVVRRHGARVRHVHAKDVRADVLARARRAGLDFPTAVGAGLFAPLGAGLVDFPRLLDDLVRQGYRGWLVVEQDLRIRSERSGLAPLRLARTSRAFLEQRLGV